MSTILVVEDNPSNMKLMNSVLVRSGYTVLQADDGDMAVILAIEKQPDLIFMDIHMPGTDGLTATRLLKAEPRTRHIPVIAVTARAMQGDREQILAAGCDAYLPKPIRYKEMLDTAEQFLAGKGANA